MIHNKWATAFVGILLEGGMAVVFFVRPEWFDGLLTKVVGTISIVDRYSNFGLGIFDISAIVYYLSICFLFVFITIQKIKKKRWS